MIVKVQLSLFTNHPSRRAMICDESHSLTWEGPADDRISRAMGNDVKRFFHAHLEGETIVLDSQAPWQRW